MQTTQRHIEDDSDAKRQLVDLVWPYHDMLDMRGDAPAGPRYATHNRPSDGEELPHLFFTLRPVRHVKQGMTLV